MNRRAAAVAVAALAIVAAALLPASPVFAHTSFVSSDPIDGSVLAHAPAVATLQFDEEVLLDASSAELLLLGVDRVEQLDLSQGDRGGTVVIAMPDLPPGQYIIRYLVIDPADLHRTVGSISFGVGVAAPPSTTGEQVGGSLVAAALRTLTDGALLLGGGTVLLLLLHRDGDAADRRKRRLEQWLPACAIAVVAGWIGLLLLDAADVGWGNVGWTRLLTDSDPGRRVLIGAQLAAGTWWAVALHRKAATRSTQMTTGKLLATLWLGFLVLASLGGHSTVGGTEIVGVGLRALHLAALSAWLGAMAMTWWVQRASVADGEQSWWPTTSRAAAWGLAATGASGLVLSGRTISTVTAALSSEYGRLVVGKLALLGVLAVLGLLSARRIGRGAGSPGWPVRLELGGALVALILVGLLTGMAPARGERFNPLVVPDPQVTTADLHDLTVSVTVQPARPGPNLLQLRVLDTRRPAPGTIESVHVEVTDSTGRSVASLNGAPTDGVIEWASLMLPAPGRYEVTATVNRPALPVPPFEAEWSAQAAPVPRVDTIVSARVLGPLVSIAAVAWLILVAAAAVLIRRRNAHG